MILTSQPIEADRYATDVSDCQRPEVMGED